MSHAASVDIAIPARAGLGEGPRWDAARRRLLWVDIDAGELHTFDPASGRDDAIPVAGVSAAAPMRSGGILVALTGAIALLPPDGGEQQVAAVLPHPGDVRCNDGACDPAGRFWVGTMANDERPDGGALYRYSADGGLDRVLPEVTLSNGIGWSPDGSRMYYIDSPTYRLDVFDFDVASGSPTNRRTLVALEPEEGIPDGLAVDDEGCVWFALWGGYSVRRYTPEGRLDRTIAVPAENVTACCFGGDDGRSLYITTATSDVPPERLAEQPLAGHVFVTDAGVSGPPAQPFAG